MRLLYVLAIMLCAARLAAAPQDPAFAAVAALYQYDSTQPLNLQLAGVTTFPECRMLKFSYASANGQRVPALLFAPTDATAGNPAPCLVMLHGLNRNKESMEVIARYAATLGYASLAIDMYNQGERAPTPTGAPATAADVQQELTTGVPQTVIDVRRGLDYLATRPNIDHSRIGLLGVSLGAIMGTVATGIDTRIKAAVLISGGGDWALILRSLADRGATLGGQPVQGLQDVDWTLVSTFLAPYDPMTFAPHIAPRPLLMVNGKLDNVIVPQAAQELYESAKSPADSNAKIDWLADQGHIPPAEVVEPIVKTWLAANL